MAGSCEYGNENSGSIRGEKLFAKPNEWLPDFREEFYPKS
jgi:hypothetical protein